MATLLVEFRILGLRPQHNISCVGTIKISNSVDWLQHGKIRDLSVINQQI